LKQVTTYILALLIFLQPFSKIWIVVSFKINQESIAKTLCVKKEVENNTCQGKCHLKKQLDKADEEEKKQAPTNTKEKVEVLYCHNLINFSICRKIYFADKKQSFFDYKFQYSSSYHTDIFRPPKFSLI
jgi:hypothetical protein